MTDSDVIVVGAGLAGLVAACELADRGRTVLIVDQENSANLGGQAFWSFGGLFFVDSPEQRRLGIRDSHELALQDWLGTAGFDRPEDHWPRQWAHAYVDFAAGEKHSWLRSLGHRVFPLVGWAERGGYDARGHGNSVPRFHITWGTGPALVEIFARRLVDRSGVRFAHRHRVDELIVEDGVVTGVRGALLEPSTEPRGAASSRNTVGDFEFRAQAVVLTSGGIGANHDMVRKNWPVRMGRVPDQLISGVPAHVDGRMLGIAEAAGANLINPDRMWHYTEGIQNWNPIWTRHGIKIIPGPSSLWL
ncbi:MAG: FAD-binding dehydrogenase, partial [Mycobacteriaceae bacterium]|nr:FAD-binding dehydrogenase [Mycobacteriaceae bacterium]